MITKEQLIEAQKQCLNILANGKNLKIKSIINDVYFVSFENSSNLKSWTFERFNDLKAVIEQPKPKIDFSILKRNEIFFAKVLSGRVLFKYDSTSIEFFDNIISEYQYFIDENKTFNLRKEINKRCCEVDSITELRLPTEAELELFYSKFPELKPKKYNGRAVKCDNLEQILWLHYKINPTSSIKGKTFNENCYVDLLDSYFITIKDCNLKNYEIISFYQYCSENGITEPKYIQGFEIKDGYNDVVMCSFDNKIWHTRVLKSILNNQFIDNNGNAWHYCRYPRKEEINEIKYVD